MGSVVRRLRDRAKAEGGFTLVELLVVILIIGILAAIAIPAFLSQRDKASDATAKSYARSSQTAMETYATDNNGSYVGATPAALTAIESTLANATGLAVGSATATGYSLSTNSGSGNVFTIARAGGTFTRTCTTAGTGGCPGSGTW